MIIGIQSVIVCLQVVNSHAPHLVEAVKRADEAGGTPLAFCVWYFIGMIRSLV